MLAGVAVLGTCVWLALGFATSDGGQSRYSRGQVAKVHEKWNNDCQACHVPFSPISEQSLFMSHPSPADKNCQDCHAKNNRATGDHYVGREPASNQLRSCAGCHRDHHGAEADYSLVRLADADCASCHKDLKNHYGSGKPIVFANDVTSFAKHPEFGAYSKGVKDPGKLKFNHKLHMQPGQVPADGIGAYTLDKIKTLDRGAMSASRTRPGRRTKRTRRPSSSIAPRVTCRRNRLNRGPPRRRRAVTCSRSSTTPIARRAIR